MLVSESGKTKRGRTYWALLVSYLAFVVYGSLVPLRFEYLPLSQAWETFKDIPYLSLGIASRSDLVANLLLFMPLTFLAMGALTLAGLRRYRWAVGVFVGASVLSGTIEFTQIYFPARTVSLNDIIAECTGGAIGIVLWLAFGGRIHDWAVSLWLEHGQGRLAVKILLGYTVGLVIYQMLPLDLTISPVEMYHKFKDGKVTLIPFTDREPLTAYMLTIKTAVMIPVGFLLAVVGRGRRHPVWTACGWGFVFAVGLECLQLCVWSRYTSSTDVIVATLGAMIGGGLSDRFGPTARRPFVATALWQRFGGSVRIAAAVIWITLSAWLRWRPFTFRWPEEGLAAYAYGQLRVPLFHLYQKAEFAATAQVTREFASAFILGMLLAGAGSTMRKGGRRIAIVGVLIVTVGLEAGQLFIPSRIPALTSIGIGMVGGIFGVLFYPVFVKVFVDTPDQAGE